MAKEDVIRQTTIHNLMDMASRMKINHKASRLTKEFVDFIILEIVKKAEEMCIFRKKSNRVIMIEDVSMALQWLGYKPFVDAKVEEVLLKEVDDDADTDRKIPTGRYSVQEEDPGEYPSGTEGESE